MSIRRMVTRAAVIGILTGAVAAATAAPASATTNDDACSAAWGVVGASQEAMGSTFSNEEFWYYHRIWAGELSWISSYC